MAYELEMAKDGILRLSMIGDIDDTEAEQFLHQLKSYLETATVESPLNILADVSRAGRMSPSARRAFVELNNDLRLGHLGVYEIRSFLRVFAVFIMKVTKRQNVRFFDSEADALAWLLEVCHS